MGYIFDFLVSALPWIAIGIFAACSCVMVKTKQEGKELSSFLTSISKNSPTSRSDS